jgi:two-component system sensor histidine kinase DegS
MDRWITLSLLAVGLATTILVAARVVDPVVGSGAVTENPGGKVLQVEAGGIAWQDGIRPGQEVVALGRADEPGGWRIVTLAADGGQIVSRGAPAERKLDASWPLVIGAFVALVVSAALVRRRPRESEMASATAVLLAAGPSSITAGSAVAGLVLPAALLLPAAWLARWSGWRVTIRWLPLAVAAVLAAAWLVSRATASPLFDRADQVRFGLTIVLACVVLLAGLARRPAPGLGWLADPQTSTVLSLSILAGIAVGLAMVVRLPWPATLATAAVAIAAFPVLRRVTGAATDRLLFAEIRARSAAAALESERSRLAREIHDAPLQELSGIIRSLDLRPEMEHETEALREVADQLRSISTNLYPPALEDLGLVAALKFMAYKAREMTPDISIEIDLADAAGDRGGRPPAEVELAVLRIVQEALGNAVRHSGASTIRVAGRISSSIIDVVISDDGRGISRAAYRSAQQRGSMGLSSMERRAAAIGAELERLGVKPSGTRLQLRWRA